MKNKNIFRWIRGTIFVVIAALLFSYVSMVVERKTVDGSWNYMGKLNEFYEMPENSIDVIAVGSSHAYCTMNPLEIWNNNNITSFVLATQQQPLNASYYYVKEAFKTQSPKVVIVEGFMGYVDYEYPKDGVAYDAIDPLRPSLNKLALIREIVPSDQRENYYFNVLKYHSRWREVKKPDYNPAYRLKADSYKGFVLLTDNKPFEKSEIDYEKVNQLDIPAVPLEALNALKELITENGAEMILLIAPFDHIDENIASVMKAEREWAQENDVDLIDINVLYDDIGIDGKTDFYDSEHLNAYGANKVSRYLGDYLKENYSIEPNTNADSEKWNNDYKKAEAKINKTDS